MNLQEFEAKVRAMKTASLSREDVQTWASALPPNGFDETEARELIDLVFQEPSATESKRALPKIITTGRSLQDKTTDAIAAVIESNDPPRIFRHAGGLARVELTEKGQPVTKALGEAAVRGELERAAGWFTVSGHGAIPTAPPLDVVRDFLTIPGGWPGLPVIQGITETPIIRPDGTILDVQGYDPATGLYYYPATNTTVPRISQDPSQEDIRNAVTLLREVFCDFPFDSEISRTNVLAALVSPVVRPLVTGPTPLCVIDKTQVGSGASLIATVISWIATGRPAAMMNAPRDPDEWRKTIVSLLLQGRGIVIIDNVDGSLYDANLAAVLTATVYSARALGRLEQKDLPNLATWICTGNNVKLAGDMPRRAYLSRIDVGMARPWQRDPKMFKHPEIEVWASTNRGMILAAILTVARAWIVAGRPLPAELPRLGGYESWVRTVGGILDHAGILGFLGNLNEMYDRNDAETPAWAAFVSALYRTFEDKEGTSKAVTSAEIAKALSDDAAFEAALPIDPPHRDRKSGVIDDSGFTRRLGNALAARDGRIYPGDDGKEYKLCRVGETKRALQWQVIFKNAGEFTPPNTTRSLPKGEFGEFQIPSNARPSEAIMEERGEVNSQNSPSTPNSGTVSLVPSEVAAGLTKENPAILPLGKEKCKTCDDEWAWYAKDGVIICGKCQTPQGVKL